MAQPSARVLSRVERVCDRHTDERALRSELIEVMRDAVEFRDYAWLLTDPETTVGSAPLADVRCLPELPTLIRLRYQTTVNRWTEPASSPATALLATTGGDPRRSVLWRDLLGDRGVGDIATVVFSDRFGCWGFVDLWRSAGEPAFSPGELGLLARLSAPITRAIRRCQAATFVAEPDPGPDPDGPAVLVLSPELEVLTQTVETTRYLQLLVPPATGESPVPAAAYNVAAQLLAVEAGVNDRPPSARVHLRDGIWLTCRAARMTYAGPLARADIAVTIEKTPPASRVALFSAAFGLTTRETELIGHVVAGGDTREVAARMFLSQLTVQDHLKSVFAKTGSRSRLELTSRAVGA